MTAVVETTIKETHDLNASREQAQAQFAAMQWPPHNQDGWRRIDLSKLPLDNPQMADGRHDVQVDEVISGANRSGLLLMHNGQVVRRELDPELEAKGVQLLSLAEAASQHPEMVNRHIGSAVANNLNRFTAQNAASWRDGFFLLIPAEVEIDRPFYLLNLGDADGSTTISRTLIMAARSSRASVISHTVSPQGVAVHNNTVVELLLGEGANLRFANVQELSQQSSEIAEQRIVLNPNSTLTAYNVGLGGKLTRTQVDAAMTGAGSTANLIGLYFPTGSQYMEYGTLQDHAGPHTTSSLTYKGVLEEKGRSVFEGMILVRPDGRFSSSGMTNRNLLLSKTAHADSVPNLEIKANEILKCSHASSLGPVDSDLLFYIQSRGLAPEIATRVIVEGFFEEVLNQLDSEELHTHLTSAIRARLGDTVAYTADSDEEEA